MIGNVHLEAPGRNGSQVAVAFPIPPAADPVRLTSTVAHPALTGAAKAVEP
jgi:hypothetical protein